MGKKEIWKDIPGYEGLYQVSNLGRVKSLERVVRYKGRHHTVAEKIKNGTPKENDYLVVSLYKNNVGKMRYIHRLVAEVFIPNPANKPTVNHINLDVFDNRVENLEWSTYAEQELHKIAFTGYLGNSKAVRVIYRDGRMQEYESESLCARQLGVHRDTLIRYFRGEVSTKINELGIRDIIKL